MEGVFHLLIGPEQGSSARRPWGSPAPSLPIPSCLPGPLSPRPSNSAISPEPRAAINSHVLSGRVPNSGSLCPPVPACACPPTPGQLPGASSGPGIAPLQPELHPGRSRVCHRAGVGDDWLLRLSSTSPGCIQLGRGSARVVVLFLPTPQCLAHSLKYTVGTDAGQGWMPVPPISDPGSVVGAGRGRVCVWRGQGRVCSHEALAQCTSG